MQRLLQPKVLIPAVVSAGIIVGLLSIAGPGSIVEAIGRFSPLEIAWSVALLLGYDVVRGVQWCYLLSVQSVDIPLRGKIFAFIVGEVTKTLPLGNFFQNYLLEQQSDSASKDHPYVFSRTSAATLLIVLMELVSGLFVLAIFGLGAWTGLIRAAIALGVSGIALVALVAYFFFRRRKMQYRAKAGWKLHIVQSFRSFRQGAQDLLYWRVLIAAFVLAAIYMTLAAGVLNIVLVGCGLRDLGFLSALIAYNFSVALNLIIPFPTDVGITEAAGSAALAAMGVPIHTAVTAMVVFRIFNVVFSLGLAALCLPFFRNEFAAVLRLAHSNE